MKVVVTAAQMAELDRLTIEQFALSGILLMENAGRGVVDLILDRFRFRTVHIYCGPGNNGGDGFVIARYLKNRGFEPAVLLLSVKDKLTPDARFHFERLVQFGITPCIVQSAEDLPKEKPDLIVDALLGTGVRGSLRGLIAQAVAHLQAQGAPIVAVDIPTGVNADSGAVEGIAVKADLTATMALMKRGLLFSPGREHCGRIEIVDICMPQALIAAHDPRIYRLEKEDVGKLLPRRAPNAHKTQCGQVLVIAGSRGFTGAASLTAETALRAGAGLVYLATPSDLNVIYETKLTEVITLPTGDVGRFTAASLPLLLEQAATKDAVAVGPGMGRDPETQALIKSLLLQIDRPLVLDADGLNACVGHTQLFAAHRRGLVLTPHAGELARLTGLSADQITAEPVETAARFAKEWKCTLVLKGGPTVIAAPDGSVYINSTGNAGMATAGTGDVLTGLIASLLAQGLTPKDAAAAGVFIHGLAGDLAAEKLGQAGMIAGDLLRNVPQALMEIENAAPL
ncbi:MAG: NAD(P)H-hydrate dehydratase [candidate division KSB1 bacterium]|nr:NAD(P)H-hydrate dehydratase [candidate division KSB1 bacterium]